MIDKQLSHYYPLSGREKIGGISFEWDFINRSIGLLHYSENGATSKKAQLNETHEFFKEYIEQRARAIAENGHSEAVIKAIEWALDRKLNDVELAAYTKAFQYLHSESGVFLTYCARLVFDYHALDRELTQTALLSTTRAMYSSPSTGLLHIDLTGASGAGKNDLVNRVTALMPSEYLELFSSVSPTALQYKTIKRTYDRTGKAIETYSDKDTFRNKVICITEVADAAGFSALKALAETDEQYQYTHMATVAGVAIEMTITGPRCVIITSVEGVNDEQVKRRFIHGSVSDDTLDNKERKIDLMERLQREHKDIHDDPRLPIAQAGLDLIFSTHGVIFERVDDETWGLIQELDALFIGAGYGLTNIKQFFALCECIALWKRFNRGYTRVEIDDVLEAWYLLASIERETITRTSKQGIATLRAIKTLCDEYDAQYVHERDEEKTFTAAKRPTRRDVVKEADVSQAHIYRLLQSRPNEQGKCGELIELGYVRDVECEGHLAVELTPLGETVLCEVPRHAIVNVEEYEPKEPIFNDDCDLETKILSFDKILEILTILTDSQEYENI